MLSLALSDASQPKRCTTKPFNSVAGCCAVRPFCYANTKATFMLADRIEDYLSGHVECTALAYTDEASRLQLSEDPHIENLLARGEFFDPEQTDSFLCDHPQGMCHQGVCYELHHARESGDRLFTGMDGTPIGQTLPRKKRRPSATLSTR